MKRAFIWEAGGTTIIIIFNEIVLGEEKTKTKEDKKNERTLMFLKLSFMHIY